MGNNLTNFSKTITLDFLSGYGLSFIRLIAYLVDKSKELKGTLPKYKLSSYGRPYLD